MNRKIIENGIKWLEDAVDGEDDAAGQAVIDFLRKKLTKAIEVEKVVQAWIDVMKLDYAIDREQVFDDMIVLCPLSTDARPLVMIEMVGGWEPYVHAADVITDQEYRLLNNALKSLGKPKKGDEGV